MKSLRLWTEVSSSEFVNYRGTGEMIELPTYRIYIQLHFVLPGQSTRWRPSDHLYTARQFMAVVDTGASLTNLPYDVWQEYESEIRWIETATANDNSVTILGRKIPYRLGRVLLAASDRDGRWLPPAWTLARCHLPLEDEESVPSLLGLTSPFLSDLRGIHHRGDVPGTEHPEWWLEDPR